MNERVVAADATEHAAAAMVASSTAALTTAAAKQQLSRSLGSSTAALTSSTLAETKFKFKFKETQGETHTDRSRRGDKGRGATRTGHRTQGYHPEGGPGPRHRVSTRSGGEREQRGLSSAKGQAVPRCSKVSSWGWPRACQPPRHQPPLYVSGGLLGQCRALLLEPPGPSSAYVCPACLRWGTSPFL